MPRVCWAEEGGFRRRRRRADMSGGGARGIWHAENRFISITLVRLIARVSIGSLAAPLILSGDPRAGAGAQERPVCPCLAVGCLGLRRCPRPACLLACFFALLVVRPHVVTPLASNPRPCALQARSHLQSSASSVQETSFISVPGTQALDPNSLSVSGQVSLRSCWRAPSASARQAVFPSASARLSSRTPCRGAGRRPPSAWRKCKGAA